jgi:hypothetical protein
MVNTNAPAVIESKPLSPLDIDATKKSMDVYQRGLRALLDDDDWQTFEDKKGNEQRFLKRAGWRKIALWFNLSLETRIVDIDREAKTGRAVRARVIARATAPNGRFADGEGGASPADTFGQKPEHDLAATAATRATNRAISNLVGLGAVSAEEVDGSPPVVTGNPPILDPPWGPWASEQLQQEAAQAIQSLRPDLDGYQFIARLGQQLGDIPEAAARALRALGRYAEMQGATGNVRDIPENAPADDSSYHDQEAG